MAILRLGNQQLRARGEVYDPFFTLAHRESYTGGERGRDEVQFIYSQKISIFLTNETNLIADGDVSLGSMNSSPVSWW